MMLRLALVGIVAALGVTLPTQTECEHWFGSAGKWTNSFLANLDTWRPSERNPGSGPDGPAPHECEQCRLARLELARNELRNVRATGIDSVQAATSTNAKAGENRSDEPAKVTPSNPNSGPTIAFDRMDVFAPITVSDGFDVQVAFELTRKSERNDLVETPAPLTGSRARLEWAALSENLEVGLPRGPWRLADEDVDDEWSVAMIAGSGEKAGQTVDNLPVLNGTSENEQPKALVTPPDAVNEVGRVDVAGLQVPSSSAYGPELFDAIAGQLEEWGVDEIAPNQGRVPCLAVTVETAELATVIPTAASACGAETKATEVVTQTVTPSREVASSIPWPVFAPAPSPAPQPPELVQATTVPWPVFAPVEPAARPVTVDAANANQPAGGNAVTPPSSPAVAGDHNISSADAGWGEAVRLTQRAMRAWVSVLAGPARVEVTAR